MSTPGDPNEPRPGKDPREGRQEEEEPGQGPRKPDWWSEGTLEDDDRERPEQQPEKRPEEHPEKRPEEPITPVPPVVPPPDVPPTHEPRPTGEPRHPDLPTAPETPEPAEGGDAEETRAFRIPGGTPTYPGWEGAPPEGGGRPAPSRYEEGDQPSFQPPAAQPEQPPSPPSTPGAQPEQEPGRGPEQVPGGGPGQEPGGRPEQEPGGRPGQELGMPSGPVAAGGPPEPPEPPAPGPYGGPPEHEAATPPPGDQEPTIPGTTPSSPYGGPPGYGPPPPMGAPYGQPYQAPPGSGLATASLVLGVASPFLVFVCFTGVITAILSIVFGCVALAKHVGKGRAIAGIVISVLALILFTIVAIWFWNVVQECAHLPGQLADRCFEDRFPWMNSRRG
ncbi:hypothetical protein ACFOY2_46455 [Nonomuraea purpurea]|uniref:DUF4190 domain-containing protein n=1 Tax=Nonomuraea purpurea TaxID=1849276 RepID=A0ABV8GPU5_9ACTN